MGATTLRRRFGDRGAIMVEASLILPLLFFLVFGIIEIGGLIKSYSTTANSVRTGGRMASVAGNDALADQMVLARMSQEAAGFDPNEIEWIIIWHAAGPDSSVPGNCVTAADAGLAGGSPNSTSVGVSDGGTDAVGACNVYVLPQDPGGAFDMATGQLPNDPDYYFGCSGASDPNAGQKVDCRWPAQNRRTLISPRVLPTGVSESSRLRPDYLGITVRVEHTYLSGILGATRDITDTSINLLEPSNFGVGT
jgi:hypothetical protein